MSRHCASWCRVLTWAKMPPSTSKELTCFKADDSAFRTAALSWAVMRSVLVIQASFSEQSRNLWLRQQLSCNRDVTNDSCSYSRFWKRQYWQVNAIVLCCCPQSIFLSSLSHLADHRPRTSRGPRENKITFQSPKFGNVWPSTTASLPTNDQKCCLVRCKRIDGSGEVIPWGTGEGEQDLFRRLYATRTAAASKAVSKGDVISLEK